MNPINISLAQHRINRAVVLTNAAASIIDVEAKWKPTAELTRSVVRLLCEAKELLTDRSSFDLYQLDSSLGAEQDRGEPYEAPPARDMGEPSEARPGQWLGPF